MLFEKQMKRTNFAFDIGDQTGSKKHKEVQIARELIPSSKDVVALRC